MTNLGFNLGIIFIAIGGVTGMIAAETPIVEAIQNMIVAICVVGLALYNKQK